MVIKEHTNKHGNEMGSDLEQRGSQKTSGGTFELSPKGTETSSTYIWGRSVPSRGHLRGKLAMSKEQKGQSS